MSNVKVYFNGVEVTINKGSYTLNPSNKQNVKETEGGTLRRYIKRLGVPHISVNMPADDTEYTAIYTAYVSGSSTTVKYYNPATQLLETFYAYIDGFTADLVQDNSTSPEWNLTFEIISM